RAPGHLFEPLALINPLIGCSLVAVRKVRITTASNSARSDHDCEQSGTRRTRWRWSAPTLLKAVRSGIGQAIRTLHSDVLREEVPDRIAELLLQLDQQLRQLDQKDCDST